MTKQRPYDTKRRLSKLFRAILVLGVMKLALFVAMAMNLSFPTISFDSDEQSGQKAKIAAPVAENKVSGVWKAPASSALATQDTKSIPVVEVKEEPQGMAAIEAARTYKNAEIKPLSEDKIPDLPLGAYIEKDKAAENAAPGSAWKIPATPSIGEHLVASGIDFSKDPVQSMASSSVLAENTIPADVPDDKSGQWWRNILNINQLPVPRLGAEQVAHAASLDMPPAPSVKGASNPSPFLPPSEQMPVIPSSQDADGRVLPLRNSGQGQPQDNSPAPGAVRPVVPPATGGGSGGYANSNVLRQQEDLARREQEVLMLKQQMDMRLKDLHDAEKKVQDMIKDAKSAEDAKYKSLINMYRNMKPKQAAQALTSMEERVAIKILSGMSPKEAGEILSYADPQKTAKLSELITRMNLPGN